MKTLLNKSLVVVIILSLWVACGKGVAKEVKTIEEAKQIVVGKEFYSIYSDDGTKAYYYFSPEGYMYINNNPGEERKGNGYAPFKYEFTLMKDDESGDIMVKICSDCSSDKWTTTFENLQMYIVDSKTIDWINSSYKGLGNDFLLYLNE